MPGNIIIAKIDVTLIDNARLFKGRKANKKNVMPQYLEVVLMPTKPTSYGDYRDEQTHMIVQSVTKEEREKQVRGEILGNATEKTGRDRRPPPTAPEDHLPASPEPGKVDDDEVPF